jgi:hypothetical protein
VFQPARLTHDGDLLEPQLHDARIVAIRFQPQRITLVCEQPDQGVIELAFVEVEHMYSEGLAEQNIILDVSSRFPEAERDVLLTRMLPSITEEQRRHRKRLSGRIQSRELDLWLISPSYGGEIIVLSKGLEFQGLTR